MPDGLARLAAARRRAAAAHGRPFRGIRYVGDGVSVAEAASPASTASASAASTCTGRSSRAPSEVGVRLRWGSAVARLDGHQRRDRRRPDRRGALDRRRRRPPLAGPALGRARTRRPAGAPRFGVRRHFAARPGATASRSTGPTAARPTSRRSAPTTRSAWRCCGAARRRTSTICWRASRASRSGCGRRGTSRDRGAGPLRPAAAPASSAGTVALVGDAAGYRDAITGEGLSLAFHQALALADCLARDDLRVLPPRRAPSHRPALPSSSACCSSPKRARRCVAGCSACWPRSPTSSGVCSPRMAGRRLCAPWAGRASANWPPASFSRLDRPASCQGRQSLIRPPPGRGAAS